VADHIESTLAEILSLVLERTVSPGEVLRREEEPRWDSLKHLEIVFAVEAAFGLTLSTDEIAAIESAADLDLRIRRHAP
jgi:acyl carrier protein